MHNGASSCAGSSPGSSTERAHACLPCVEVHLHASAVELQMRRSWNIPICCELGLSTKVYVGDGMAPWLIGFCVFLATCASGQRMVVPWTPAGRAVAQACWLQNVVWRYASYASAPEISLTTASLPSCPEVGAATSEAGSACMLAARPMPPELSEDGGREPTTPRTPQHGTL